ncbi:uncharacterized protein NEPG_02005 [Nematocida parisii ERTm1]|uniref:uncharacterized protein n=1 Tax=Nematocida parisii (strain ERTm1 / ATCC PRA-289) TaxID=881290 RepID=UPI000264B9A0|nr:uncharacterized protein NEPG_02005 [Nematocida parisii ERTm1]EIJ93049.1 hypothetical protein NEPG_02005 [Nematocida parisii ERTm1]|eukprot:XP_013059832.1 hypothetical protein NEPG_02005 [Nematocida parisii ERTm1]
MRHLLMHLLLLLKRTRHRLTTNKPIRYFILMNITINNYSFFTPLFPSSVKKACCATNLINSIRVLFNDVNIKCCGAWHIFLLRICFLDHCLISLHLADLSIKQSVAKESQFESWGYKKFSVKFFTSQ